MLENRNRCIHRCYHFIGVGEVLRGDMLPKRFFFSLSGLKAALILPKNDWRFIRPRLIRPGLLPSSKVSDLSFLGVEGADEDGGVDVPVEERACAVPFNLSGVTGAEGGSSSFIGGGVDGAASAAFFSGSGAGVAALGVDSTGGVGVEAGSDAATGATSGVGSGAGAGASSGVGSEVKIASGSSAAWGSESSSVADAGSCVDGPLSEAIGLASVYEK